VSSWPSKVSRQPARRVQRFGVGFSAGLGGNIRAWLLFKPHIHELVLGVRRRPDWSNSFAHRWRIPAHSLCEHSVDGGAAYQIKDIAVEVFILKRLFIDAAPTPRTHDPLLLYMLGAPATTCFCWIQPVNSAQVKLKSIIP
jgi:hypothetical protein